MKKIYLLSIALISAFMFVACANTHEQNDHAVGEIKQEQLLAKYSAFLESYQSFEIDPLQKSQIQNWPADLKVEVYFGTWCHDSEREVPHLLKALQSYHQESITLFALDTNKNDPQGRAQKMKVKYTPTFVVYLAGKEIGRIVERPDQSLVDDISLMIAKENLS